MVRINNSRQELSRERVYNFYIENKSLGKRYTINHFKAENFPERTIYSIIERAENEIGPKRVFESGRIAKIMTKKNVAKLNHDHQDGVSQRQAGRKFKCHMW